MYSSPIILCLYSGWLYGCMFLGTFHIPLTASLSFKIVQSSALVFRSTKYDLHVAILSYEENSII